MELEGELDEMAGHYVDSMYEGFVQDLCLLTVMNR